MATLRIYGSDTLTELPLPFADEGVRAGFPSPAQNYMENSIDLNRDLVEHPESTFFARVEGSSMIEAGLEEGDILVIDRSIDARDGDIVVCALNGEFTVKYLQLRDGGVRLLPANPEFAPIDVEPGDRFEVWGAVTYIIHKAKHK